MLVLVMFNVCNLLLKCFTHGERVNQSSNQHLMLDPRFDSDVLRTLRTLSCGWMKGVLVRRRFQAKVLDSLKSLPITSTAIVRVSGTFLSEQDATSLARPPESTKPSSGTYKIDRWKSSSIRLASAGSTLIMLIRT